MKKFVTQTWPNLCLQVTSLRSWALYRVQKLATIYLNPLFILIFLIYHLMMVCYPVFDLTLLLPDLTLLRFLF